jgi:hypothetical protein
MKKLIVCSVILLAMFFVFSITAGFAANVVGQPAQPSAQAIYLASVKEKTGINHTNLGINNLSDLAAHVTVVLVNNQGIVLAIKQDAGTTVPAFGMVQLNQIIGMMMPAAVTAGVEATLFLESDQPIKAWASEIENSNNDPSMLVSRTDGATRILIPSTVNSTRWTSSLVLVNISSSTASCSLKAYDANGAIVGQTQTPIIIPAHGFYSIPNVLQPLGIVDAFGHPLEVNSNFPLMAISRVFSQSNTGGFFEGIDYANGSLLQYVPILVEDGIVRTNLGVNNISDTTATVFVRYLNDVGFEVRTKFITVPPRSLYQINSAEIIDFFSQIGTPGIYCYVQLNSDQPVIGWSSEIDNSTGDPGFAISKGEGQQRILLQSSANSSTWHSSLVVVNTGVLDTYTDVVARDSSGAVMGQATGLFIRSRGMYTADNILENLGLTNFFGPISITSNNGAPLIVTSRIISVGRTSAFFEGQELP